MKEPNIKKLRLDRAETARIRKIGKRAKTIKITVNIDASSLALLKKEASATGIPYQRLLNQVLRKGLDVRGDEGARLERLERQVARLSRKFAA